MPLLRLAIWLGWIALFLASRAFPAGDEPKSKEALCLFSYFRLAVAEVEGSKEVTARLATFDRKAWLAYAKDIAEWGYSVSVDSPKLLDGGEEMTDFLIE